MVRFCITLFVIVWLSCSITWGANSKDCHIFDINTAGNTAEELLQNVYTSIMINNKLQTWQIFDLYPNQNILVALQHLQYYCCERNLLTTHQCPTKNADGQYDALYAESPYLFDHLLEIGLRSLDGDTKRQYDDAILNPQGFQRRTEITKLATAVQGVIPAIVVEQYQAFWRPEQGIFKMNLVSSSDVFTTDNFHSQWTNTDKNYKDESGFGLKNKYFGMCFVAAAITNQTPNISQTIKKSEMKKCLKRVTDRVQNEFNYIKQVMIQQGASLVANNFKQYTDGYFARAKLQRMLEKFGQLQSLFLVTNQKINKATRNCVQ